MAWLVRPAKNTLALLLCIRAFFATRHLGSVEGVEHKINRGHRISVESMKARTPTDTEDSMKVCELQAKASSDKVNAVIEFQWNQ